MGKSPSPRLSGELGWKVLLLQGRCSPTQRDTQRQSPCSWRTTSSWTKCSYSQWDQLGRSPRVPVMVTRALVTHGIHVLHDYVKSWQDIRMLGRWPAHLCSQAFRPPHGPPSSFPIPSPSVRLISPMQQWALSAHKRRCREAKWEWTVGFPSTKWLWGPATSYLYPS